MSIAAGALDRRIQFQVGIPGQDAAGDELLTWENGPKRWAAKRDRVPTENPALAGAQQVLRQVDTDFQVRADSFTTTVGPETHRVAYKDRIYEIVGLAEGDRADTIKLLCSSRPDQRGARGREPVSGQP